MTTYFFCKLYLEHVFENVEETDMFEPTVTSPQLIQHVTFESASIWQALLTCFANLTLCMFGAPADRFKNVPDIAKLQVRVQIWEIHGNQHDKAKLRLELTIPDAGKNTILYFFQSVSQKYFFV
jgi:hypothetical protein